MTTSRGLSPPPRPKPLIKSTASTPNIRKMAVATQSNLSHANNHFRLGPDSLSTLRDPRSTGDLREAASIAAHPDLSQEVATLSNKLISAINHQTHLDDALAATKEDLRQTRDRLEKAEARNAEWDSLLKEGRLMRKAEFDESVNDLLRKLNTEKKARDLSDREKRAIEMELADLSTKLFEEANELVSKARRETESEQIRTEQVRGQLAEAESLLGSQQEQLAQLKAILERSTDQTEGEMTASTGPPTPAMGTATFEQSRGPDTPQFPGGESVDPAPPLTFSHLIAPALRADVPAYEDFKALLEINKKAASQPPSRVTSGTYAGMSTPNAAPSPTPTSGSQTNLAANASQPHSPSNSSSMPGSLYSPTSYLPLLRETKFFKRAVAEDIEPTLRLDIAPGLSYFNRRSVTAAINDNTLILDPVPSSSRRLITSCTLCGERRRGDEYSRTHRFKTGDDSAQWYPLCAFCVTRFRSVCDYIAFLRMIRDGFWKCEGKEAESKAWEESVRLRERLFWARIGGGVVPAGMSRREQEGRDSQRTSLEVGTIAAKAAAPVHGTGNTVSLSKQISGEETAKLEPTTTNSEDEENVLADIRELPSTAPPLQATMATDGGDSTVSPARLSFTDSLKRISLRESLRFGSRSRNASTERSAMTPTAAASPRLGAVEESKVDENFEEVSKTEVPAEDGGVSEESDGLNIKLPGGF